jgi:3-hydroxyacyl-CoA dehydrogenase/enoyl-CoA hydratase/3-hydroxybutyryl-CoA epimerase
MSADTEPTGTALRVELEDGVAVITFDLPGERVNKFAPAVIDEFAAVLDRLQRDANVRAAVLISGKPDIFIAGADIEQFLTIRSAADGEAMSAAGQMMMDRIAKLRTPLVAAIHGACLGGGLEASLACAYRICTDHPKTVISVPEVMLGIIPGAGGTQRLPRTVGLRNALDMILTGRNVRAKKALQMGLVDEMVHPAILREIAVDRARKLGAGSLRRSRGARGGGLMNLLLEKNPLGRALVFRQARAGVLQKTHGNFPAPLAALEAVEAGITGGPVRGYHEEARLFGEMAVTPASQQLTFLFFATTALKKDSGTDVPVQPLPVDRLGILGAGFMGSGIASIAVAQKTAVRLKDAAPDRVAKGMKAVSDVLRERLTRKQITRREFSDLMTLVGGTVDYSGFAFADLVIEAVFEDLALKHKVLKETEAVIPGDAIYASNTSTIPITRIAEASQRPEQVLGMHFFSPVPKMPLLEVIVTRKTSPVATATAAAYGKKLGKHVIVVNDGPGFYTTRTLSAYMNEAGYLLDEGVSIEALDHAMVDAGFPVGPITLMDEVGLDVGGKVGQVIYDAFGDRLKPSLSLSKVVADGRTGRKGGRGFYRYEGGKKRGVDQTVYALLPTGATRKEMAAAEMQQRCMLALLNEAARCLEDGVLRSPRDGDVGAVFGIGFPPFLGGPFRHIDSEGAANIVRQLEMLHQRFSPRFEPCKLLVGMAQTKARFYPESGNPLG